MKNTPTISLHLLYDASNKNYGSQGCWPLLLLKPEINPTNQG